MNSEKNLKSSRKRKKLFYNFCYDFVKVTGALPILLWLRPKIYRPYGTKTLKKGVLVSANHRSMLDPVIVHVIFPTRRMNCLATKDLFNTELKRRFFNQMHCIEVDKDNFTLSAFHEVVLRLQNEKMVVIFPEGGLNRDKEDTIHTFKSGAVLMAHKSKKPILPVYIVKREKWYHRQRIVVGEPFYVSESVGAMPTLAEINVASDNLRKMEIELREYFELLPIYEKLNKNKEIELIEGRLKDEQKV